MSQKAASDSKYHFRYEDPAAKMRGGKNKGSELEVDSAGQEIRRKAGRALLAAIISEGVVLPSQLADLDHEVQRCLETALASVDEKYKDPNPSDTAQSIEAYPLGTWKFAREHARTVLRGFFDFNKHKAGSDLEQHVQSLLKDMAFTKSPGSEVIGTHDIGRNIIEAIFSHPTLGLGSDVVKNAFLGLSLKFISGIFAVIQITMEEFMTGYQLTIDHFDVDRFRQVAADIEKAMIASIKLQPDGGHSIRKFWRNWEDEATRAVTSQTPTSEATKPPAGSGKQPQLQQSSDLGAPPTVTPAGISTQAWAPRLPPGLTGPASHGRRSQASSVASSVRKLQIPGSSSARARTIPPESTVASSDGSSFVNFEPDEGLSHARLSSHNAGVDRGVPYPPHPPPKRVRLDRGAASMGPPALPRRELSTTSLPGTWPETFAQDSTIAAALVDPFVPQPQSAHVLHAQAHPVAHQTPSTFSSSTQVFPPTRRPSRSPPDGFAPGSLPPQSPAPLRPHPLVTPHNQRYLPYTQGESVGVSSLSPWPMPQGFYPPSQLSSQLPYPTTVFDGSQLALPMSALPPPVIPSPSTSNTVQNVTYQINPDAMQVHLAQPEAEGSHASAWDATILPAWTDKPSYLREDSGT